MSNKARLNSIFGPTNRPPRDFRLKASQFLTLRELQKLWIEIVLRECKGSVWEAAKRLGIPRRTLQTVLASSTEPIIARTL
jgi:ActR/RegA family two-component response regulator